jgi:hypothetical protein
MFTSKMCAQVTTLQTFNRLLLLLLLFTFVIDLGYI